MSGHTTQYHLAIKYIIALFQIAIHCLPLSVTHGQLICCYYLLGVLQHVLMASCNISNFSIAANLFSSPQYVKLMCCNISTWSVATCPCVVSYGVVSLLCR